MTTVIFSVRMRALGMLFFDLRSCTLLDSTGCDKDHNKSKTLAWQLEQKHLRVMSHANWSRRTTVDSIRYLFFLKKKKELTAVFGHFLGDLKQYPGVAGDHDEEWKEEEEGEGKHVVKCLVPAWAKAAIGRTLDKPLGGINHHNVENKHLEKEDITGIDIRYSGARLQVTRLLQVTFSFCFIYDI